MSATPAHTAAGEFGVRLRKPAPARERRGWCASSKGMQSSTAFRGGAPACPQSKLSESMSPRTSDRDLSPPVWMVLSRALASASDRMVGFSCLTTGLTWPPTGRCERCVEWSQQGQGVNGVPQTADDVPRQVLAPGSTCRNVPPHSGPLSLDNGTQRSRHCSGRHIPSLGSAGLTPLREAHRCHARV